MAQPLLRLLVHGLPEVVPGGDVQPRGGFVEDQHPGSANRARANLIPCCSPPEQRETRLGEIFSRPATDITAPTIPRRMVSRGSNPQTRSVPEVEPVNPSAMSKMVVFPAPLGPRKATVSPVR